MNVKKVLFTIIIFEVLMLFIFFLYEKQDKKQGALVVVDYDKVSTINVDEIKSKIEKRKVREYLNESKVKKIEKSIEIAKDAEIPKNISLGNFKLTAYCPCNICCGKWSGGATASGVMPKANHTIAVDTNIIPFGTKIIINGNTYVAEDTGSAIKGNRIDIYMSDHNEALKFGVQQAEVFKVNN